MKASEEPIPTPKEVRKNSGLKLREILAELAKSTSKAPKSHTGLIHLEERGTNKLPILRGLSKAYDIPIDQIEQIFQPGRNNLVSK